MMIIYTDGASRGNPGPSAAGITISEDDSIIYKKGVYLGKMTNNQSEYNALIHALKIAKLHGKNVKCYSDSELMVRQLNGEYKVKNPNIWELYNEIEQLKKKFEFISFEHVPRSTQGIKAVDKLANEVLDEHGKSKRKNKRT